MGDLNKDLITKLAKLANNNPNENEANSAARRVCKLLAEANFNFGSAPARTAQEKVNQHRSNYSNGPITWNDVRRSNEPAWKSVHFDDEFFSGFDWGANRKAREQERPKWTEKPPEKKERVSRDRTCTKCKHIFPTFNDREPYVCTVCTATAQR